MRYTRERPASGAASGAVRKEVGRGADDTSVAPAPAAPAQLRRRRATAERLPVFPCDCGDPWHAEPLRPSQSNLAAARRAWMHLQDLDLLDSDGHLTAVLAGDAP